MSKQAMELALNDLEDWLRSYGPTAETLKVIAALKEAIKQQDSPNYSLGEPVAVAHKGLMSDGFTMAVFDAFNVPVGTPLYTSAPSIPEGWQLVRIEVVEFLRGAGPLDGLWFGDSDTEKPRKRYWWRKYLDAATSYKGEQP